MIRRIVVCLHIHDAWPLIIFYSNILMNLKLSRSFLCVDLLTLILKSICVLSVTSGHDASQITLALGTAAAYPRACQALGAMLSKGALNPADITVLFKMFSSMDPPPVELVRVYFGSARFLVHFKPDSCFYFGRMFT